MLIKNKNKGIKKSSKWIKDYKDKMKRTVSKYTIVKGDYYEWDKRKQKKGKYKPDKRAYAIEEADFSDIKEA